jgi:hypothetical protein
MNNSYLLIHLNLITILYLYSNWLIDWCLTPTLAIFQLYRGVYSNWSGQTGNVQSI